MVHTAPESATSNTPSLQYSFHLLRHWLTRWGHQFPNGTPLSYRKLFFPLHWNGNHWACLAINFTATTVTYLDSKLPDALAEEVEYGQKYATQGLQFLHEEHQLAYNLPDIRAWTLIGSTKQTVPQQTNGYDCGVYTCLYADHIMQDRPLVFSPAQVHGAQAHIALAIIQGQAYPKYTRPHCDT